MAISRVDLLNFTTVQDADADLTPELDWFSGPCRVYGVIISGTISEAGFVHLYDDLNPVVGTTAQEMVLPYPTSTGICYQFLDQPLEFANGLSAIASTAAAGTGAPTSNAVAVTVIGKRGLA